MQYTRQCVYISLIRDFYFVIFTIRLCTYVIKLWFYHNVFMTSYYMSHCLTVIMSCDNYVCFDYLSE